MKFFKDNQLISHSIIWIASGALAPVVATVVVFFTFFTWLRNEKFLELFLGLWLVLIFSDSAIPYFRFAEVVKPLVVLVLTFVLFSQSAIKIDKFFYGFIPFFLYALLISVLDWPTFLTSFQKLVSYFFILLIVPSFIAHLREQSEEKLFKYLLYTGYVILAASLLLLFVFPGLGVTYGGRLNGIFRNPNGIGLFTALLGMLTLVIFHFRPEVFSGNEKRMAFFIILATLFFSGSRNSMVSLFLFFLISRLNKASSLVGIVSIFIIVLGAVWLSQNLESILSSLGYADFFRLDTLDEASGRVFVWEAAWAEIQRKFFWVGESFSYSETTPWMKKYYAEFPDLIYHQGNIHNSYLTFWMNTGLVGLLLFFIPLLGYIGKAMFKSHFALPLLVSVGFMAFFESFLIASLNPFTIIFFMILILLLQGKDFTSSQKEVPLQPEKAVA